ncbi:MAG: hypothetical protein RLZZ08_648 [Pseudomonadota bacterium]
MSLPAIGDSLPHVPFALIMRRLIAGWLLALALLWLPAPAQAEVQVHFHSFNGSMFAARYPHTFVVFEGHLADGTPVNENFGFSARSASPAVLAGPVAHMIYIEKPKWVQATNRHFSVTVSDATYHRLRAEVAAWQNAPGKYYDLNHRNCIHFVGRIAELVGLKVDYPHGLLRKPKAWLNHIATLNPQLGARQIA